MIYPCVARHAIVCLAGSLAKQNYQQDDQQNDTQPTRVVSPASAIPAMSVVRRSPAAAELEAE